MSQIFEYSKRIAVSPLNVSGALRVLKYLADRGIIDSHEAQGDLAKRMSVDSDLLKSIIDMLLSYGILRRKSVRELKITNREQVLETIHSLEEFFSDKVVVPDGYKCSFFSSLLEVA